MTGYEAFGIYQALKLHFTRESYDYFKYNGKTNITINSFDNRKDKYYYHKLSRKYPDKQDFCNLLVANLLQKDNLWVAELLQEEAEIVYKKHQKVIQSLSYTFENDCRELFEDVGDPNDIIKVKNGDHPILLKHTLQKNIHFETTCLLNKILNFLPAWNKNITDTIIWPNCRLKIVKYATFLPSDVVKYKLILKRIIT